MNEKAVIGIGTNLGDKIENIRRAIEAIKLLPDTKSHRCAGIFRYP